MWIRARRVEDWGKLDDCFHFFFFFKRPLCASFQLLLMNAGLLAVCAEATVNSHPGPHPHRPVCSGARQVSVHRRCPHTGLKAQLSVLSGQQVGRA